MKTIAIAGAFALLALTLGVADVRADETCQSPYLPKVVGHEDFIYVWTLGIEGVGDGNDKVVTVSVNPARSDYGKVIASTSVPGRNEAHHAGFTDDRRHLWVGALDTSQIFIFDVATDPANPKLVKTIDDFVAKSGGIVGPHTFYALPGRMLITGLSNDKDWGGKTGMVEYSNDGEYIRTIWFPDDASYGYDVRVNPRLNRMLTSSFTGHKNYMRSLPDLMADAEAMKNFGNSVILWDYHARKPLQTFEIPGAPLEIRWALQPDHHYAFTSTALTAKLWGIFRKDDGTFEAVELHDIGDPAKVPLPLDISISSDDRFLFVDSFDGFTRVFDISEPRRPKLILEKKIAAQLNMVSQSWDGKRVYFTSSLLANWDKTGADNEQYVKAFTWDGRDLTPTFEIDFMKEQLGRPHLMRFGQAGFYSSKDAKTYTAEAR
jgi:selenium-binding protein 1